MSVRSEKVGGPVSRGQSPSDDELEQQVETKQAPENPNRWKRIFDNPEFQKQVHSLVDMSICGCKVGGYEQSFIELLL